MSDPSKSEPNKRKGFFGEIAEAKRLYPIPFLVVVTVAILYSAFLAWHFLTSAVLPPPG